MSAETSVEIHLRCFERLQIIDSFSSNLNSSFQTIEESTNQVTQSTTEMGEAYQNASNQVDEINSQYAAAGDIAEKTGGNFGDSAVKINSVALAGATLAMSFENVERSQVALDRANLNVQRSTESVDQAQKNAAAAVEKYGVNSVQAKDAQDKLAIATDALSVAQERQGLASNRLNETMVFSALSVIPSFIAIVEAAGGAEEVWSSIQMALNAVMDANPIAIVVLAIAV